MISQSTARLLPHRPADTRGRKTPSRFHVAAALTVLLAGMLWSALVTPAAAQEVERIAAVVNDDVISTSDVSARLGLALMASGLPTTDDTRARLRPQVLRSLIDETLQKQEAAKFGIVADESDVQDAVDSIAENNGVSTDQLMAQLDRSGVPRRTLYDQIRTTLAWRDLVRARLLPQVSVTEEDVDAEINRLSQTEGKTEYLVAEIFLEIPNPTDTGQVMDLARQLESEIRDGASFAAIASQFSQSASAAKNGDLGWVLEGQLAPEVNEALKDLQPGQLSPPVQAPGGVYLLLLRGERVASAGDPMQAVVNAYSLTVKLPPRATQALADQMMAQMRSLQENVQSCDALADAASTMVGSQGLEHVSGRVADLPDAVRQRIASSPVGRLTSWQPLPSNDGATVYMVCDRQNQSVADIDREEIRSRIGEERVNRLARRYLRDLRNAAYIEVRG